LYDSSPEGAGAGRLTARPYAGRRAGSGLTVVGPGLEVARIFGLWRVRPPWHPGLRPYLRGYAGYWEAEHSPYRARMVPTARTALVISLGEPFADIRRLDSRVPRDSGSAGSGRIGSMVAGMDDGPAECVHHGGQESIRMEFTPLGAYRLFGMPMRELSHQVVELPNVLGRTAGELVERLAATRDWGRRFALLDAALLDRLERGPSPAPEIGRAWALMSASGGTLPVDRIAADVGWSRRYLERRFAEQVGLPPKVSARVLRFHRAMALLEGGAGPAAAAIACGYYDQAHLTRDFRALAGTTPGRIPAARRGEGAIVV
jgi:AraC-like DNA-binding protein